MKLIDVAKQFATPEACNDFLESMRWPEGVACLACESKRVSKYTKNESTRQRLSLKTGKMETKTVPARILYVCLDCKKQFSVGEGTIFSDTHLSIDKWFMAVALMVNAKKGLSALQMKRDLGCAYKTAWYLCHRIRKAMEGSEPETFTGIVEADATFIGGKFDKRRQRAKFGKQPVFGMVQRAAETSCSKVYAAPVLSEIRRVPSGDDSNPWIQGSLYRACEASANHCNRLESSVLESDFRMKQYATEITEAFKSNADPPPLKKPSTAEIKEPLVIRRETLLADYKTRTGNPSSKRIYEARNSRINKPEFYSWLRGELPDSSATTKNFEKLLGSSNRLIPKKIK